MIVMIDNHDSFTYNLIDYLTVQTTDDVQVISVDQVTIPMLKQLDPQAIVISPGPGRPSDYPILATILTEYYREVPILGYVWAFKSSLNILVGKLYIMINQFMVIPQRCIIQMKES